MDRGVLKQKLESKDFNKHNMDTINSVCDILLRDNKERQLTIATEEMAELIQELTKYLRGIGNDLGIKEEIADAFLVVNIVGKVGNEHSKIDFDDEDIMNMSPFETKDKRFVCHLIIGMTEFMKIVQHSLYDNSNAGRIETYEIFDLLKALVSYMGYDWSEIRDIIDIKVDRQLEKIKTGTVV